MEARGKHDATIYQDADDADWQLKPEAFTIERKTITNKSKLTIRLSKGGWAAVVLRRKLAE